MSPLVNELGHIFESEFKGLPYTFIPFTLCTLIILLYYLRRRISMGSQIARISRSPSLNISLHNLNKNLKFKVFVANFIILLLFLEFLINVMRSLFLFIPQPEVLEFYNLTQSCQIYNFPSLVSLLSPHYWLLYSPIILIISFQVSILPIVNLLISVLTNIFLDRPYRKRLRIGFGIIICRFFICVSLLSFFQTRILSYIYYMCLYIIDYSMYLYYSSTFHQLLSNRRNEARIHSRVDPQLFRERSLVLSQYRVTTLYTICVISIFLFLTSIDKIAALIYLVGIDPCYINYITYGYIPTFQLSLNAQNSTTGALYGMLSVSLLTLYLYELLLFIAYLAVCVSIIVKYLSNLTRQKRTQNNVARVVDEYHRDFQAYRN